MNKVLIGAYIVGWILLMIEIICIDYMPIWYQEYSWVVVAVFLTFIVFKEIVLKGRN